MSGLAYLDISTGTFRVTEAADPEAVLDEARRVGARRTYFTHITHELGHAQTNAQLPSGMELAYDGLVCESVRDEG